MMVTFFYSHGGENPRTWTRATVQDDNIGGIIQFRGWKRQMNLMGYKVRIVLEDREIDAI